MKNVMLNREDRVNREFHWLVFKKGHPNSEIDRFDNQRSTEFARKRCPNWMR